MGPQQCGIVTDRQGQRFIGSHQCGIVTGRNKGLWGLTNVKLSLQGLIWLTCQIWDYDLQLQDRVWCLSRLWDCD